MGLAKQLNLMNTKITLWTYENTLNPALAGWTKQLLLGQYLEKQVKTIDKDGRDIISSAQFVIDVNTDIQNEDYKIELGHSTDINPSINAKEIKNIMGGPTFFETQQGLEASEWIAYV